MKSFKSKKAYQFQCYQITTVQTTGLFSSQNRVTESNTRVLPISDDVGRKEGNDLFNDALNTFYLRLYGVRHMVNDHSDSEKGNPLQPHRLLFTIKSKGSFICPFHQTGYHIPQPLIHQSWSTGWNEK